MSKFTIIPFIAFLINLFLWSYIFATSRQNKSSRAYLFFSGTIGIFELSELILWTNLPDTTIALLYKIFAPIHLSICFLLMNFVFSLIDKKRNYFYYSIFTFYFIILFLQIFTDFYVDSTTINRYSWGSTAKHGPLYYPVLIVLYVIPALYCIYLLFQKKFTTQNILEKKQLGLLIYGIFLTLLLSVTSNLLIPLTGNNEFPRLGSSFFAVISIFIFIAIIKYKFLSHTIIEIAYDLFSLTNDSVIIFDYNKKIMEINKQAKQFLQITEEQINKLTSDDIFPDEYSLQNNYQDKKFELFINENKVIILLTQLPLEQANIFNGKLAIIKDITEIENTNKINKIYYDLGLSLAKTTDLQNALEMVLDSAIDIGDMDSGGIYMYDPQTMGYNLINHKGFSQNFIDKVSYLPKDSFKEKIISAGDPVFIENADLPALRDSSKPETNEGLLAAVVLPIKHMNKTIACINMASHKKKTFSQHIKNSLTGLTSQFASPLARIKAEEDLRRSSQVESLGIFAGGIAHDFNNILTGILGNISITLLEMNDKDKHFETLKEAEKAATRARELTKQLLTFSKGGAPVKKIVSINDLIKDTAKFALRGAAVKCHFDFFKNTWNSKIDEGQISQVIHNIVLNSINAMPDGGNIKIKTENISIKNNENPFLNKGNYIKILIEDEGKGIPEEDLHRIFDPYFSKREGGSGLGLTIAYSIIKNHDGYISVNSTVGKGTSISIFLPASLSELEKAQVDKFSSENLKGKILFMDDEDMIQKLGKKMLEILGLEVMIASDGEEAISIFEQAKSSNDPINLAILDLTIPGAMGGKETIGKLLKINPDLIAIVSSGYSNDPVISHYKQYGFKGCIQKPYKFDELKKILIKTTNP